MNPLSRTDRSCIRSEMLGSHDIYLAITRIISVASAKRHRKWGRERVFATAVFRLRKSSYVMFEKARTKPVKMDDEPDDRFPARWER